MALLCCTGYKHSQITLGKDLRKMWLRNGECFAGYRSGVAGGE